MIQKNYHKIWANLYLKANKECGIAINFILKIFARNVESDREEGIIYGSIYDYAFPITTAAKFPGKIKKNNFQQEKVLLYWAACLDG